VSLLEVRGLTVSYGGVSANIGVDLDVHPGRVTGLIGPNGAGKTTFVDAVTGFVRPTAGRVQFAGADITSARPAARARAGLARTFQSAELFEDLTVRDNLLVAAQRPRWYSLLSDLVVPSRRRDEGEADAEWALDVLGLGDVAELAPAALSHGQRKLVGVARALAMRPSVVLLDEPAAGLDSAESRRLGRQIRSLLDHGVAVLLIDHDMELVMEVCDELYVLDFGAVIAQGPPAAVRTAPAVIAAYLGSTPAPAEVGDE